MKVMFLSTVYSNIINPTRAPYNQQKIAYLRKRCEVVVVAPIQKFPLKTFVVKDIDKIPDEEIIDDIRVYHPRVFYTPKFFRFLHGIFYYFSIQHFIKDLNKKESFDIIFCSWVYPDGFAAMLLSRLLNKPLVVLAHGSDLRIQIRAILRKPIIKAVLRNADKLVMVSKELKDQAVLLGISSFKISVIYDGINHTLFSYKDREIARRELGISINEKIALFVGNLQKVKGLRFLLPAIKEIDKIDWKLFVIGTGGLEGYLKRTISSLNLSDKVNMLGRIVHDKLPLWMNAADVLVLPSLSEGLPSVILEAFGCGTPVVASRVGGIPEVVTDEKLGILVEPGNVRSLAEGIEKALNKGWDREYIKNYSMKFTWEKNSQELYDVLKSCVKN